LTVHLDQAQKRCFDLALGFQASGPSLDGPREKALKSGELRSTFDELSSLPAKDLTVSLLMGVAVLVQTQSELISRVRSLEAERAAPASSTATHAAVAQPSRKDITDLSGKLAAGFKDREIFCDPLFFLAPTSKQSASLMVNKILSVGGELATDFMKNPSQAGTQVNGRNLACGDLRAFALYSTGNFKDYLSSSARSVIAYVCEVDEFSPNDATAVDALLLVRNFVGYFEK